MNSTAAAVTPTNNTTIPNTTTTQLHPSMSSSTPKASKAPTAQPGKAPATQIKA